MTGQILNNPHFRPLEEKLRLRFGDDEAQRLTADIHDRLRNLLTLHANDAEDLKDESHGYILPSIAIYQTLREKVGREGALLIFREIYFVAAHQAAKSIGQKAEDATYRQQFLQMMIAKKHGARAGFDYRTIENTTTAVEFHVLRCPYVTYCQQYGCPELTPVFLRMRRCFLWAYPSASPVGTYKNVGAGT